MKPAGWPGPQSPALTPARDSTTGTWAPLFMVHVYPRSETDRWKVPVPGSEADSWKAPVPAETDSRDSPGQDPGIPVLRQSLSGLAALARLGRLPADEPVFETACADDILTALHASYDASS